MGSVQYPALLQVCFSPHGPDNPEGAAHQLQLFSGIFAQRAQRIATVRTARLCLFITFTK